MMDGDYLEVFFVNGSVLCIPMEEGHAMRAIENWKRFRFKGHTPQAVPKGDSPPPVRFYPSQESMWCIDCEFVVGLAFQVKEI
jgi:hypothetical protein